MNRNLEHEVNLRNVRILVQFIKINYTYCRNELGFSEQESWARIGAMRTLGKVKGIEDKLQKGSLNLTQVGQLGNFINKLGSEKKEEETQKIVTLIEGKTTRETKDILDDKAGKKAADMVNIKVSRELYQQFQNLKQKFNKMSDEDLLRCLCELSIKKEKAIKMEEEVKVKKPHSRYIPVNLKLKLLQKSEYQCEFVSPVTKQRCPEITSLQVHHHFPWAMGGETSEKNTSMRCRSHNYLEAVAFYGAHKMNSFKTS
jgi:hypothetical protein